VSTDDLAEQIARARQVMAQAEVVERAREQEIVLRAFERGSGLSRPVESTASALDVDADPAVIAFARAAGLPELVESPDRGDRAAEEASDE
jgi:hypothetical protein